MRIGVDIDGVVLDFERWMLAYAALYNLDVAKSDKFDNTKFITQEKYGWNEEQVMDFAKTYFVKISYKSPVLPLVKEMVERIKNDGHEVFVISTRCVNKHMVKSAKKVMAKAKLGLNTWLEGVVDFNGITWHMNKVETCKKHNIDVMIDDNPKHAEQLAAAGIKCIFMRDKGTRQVSNPLVFEADNWVDVYKIISSFK